MKRLLVAIALTTAVGPVLSASRTVTLSVPTMDCPVCPISVKKALTKVRGVTHAEVSFDLRLATVTFDDSVTNVEALTRATRDAGYPSAPTGDTR